MTGAREGRGRVGGASAAAGVGYQEGVTAWLAAHLLAESMAPRLPSLEGLVRVTTTASETDQPIDDINIATSVGITLYVQAKRAVPQLVDRSGADFTGFIEQVVDQHLALRAVGDTPESRYVLATSSEASKMVRTELRLVLDGLRDSPRSAQFESFGSTFDRRKALITTATIIRRILRDRGEEPTNQPVREILDRMMVWEIDVDGSAQSNATVLLAAAVVPSASAVQAWRTLERRALAAAQNHDVLDLDGWRRALAFDGIELRDVPSHGADVARLRSHSARTLTDLEVRGFLRAGGARLKINREAVAVGIGLSTDGPLLLVGDAGSGKSAAVAAMARSLQQGGAEVLVFDADAVNAHSLGELSAELQLDHEITEVLDRWSGSARRYLVVDGLDETRGTSGVAALRKVVARVADSGAWTLLVAVRRFDLRYSSELRAIFAGMPAPGWSDDEFADIRHIVVGDLTDAELDQLRASAPALVDMGHLPRVGKLFRRPIHLQLAADLLEGGGARADVAQLRTQLDLLDIYWTRTVEEPIPRRPSREAVLAVACRLVIAARRFTVPRSELDATNAEATTDLLGKGLLVEGEARPGSSRPIRFLHGLVAEYAIARLVLLAPSAGEDLVADDPFNALFLRRSLELWLAGLWELGGTRDSFWAVALGLAGRDDIPEIAKLIAPTIAAESWTAIDDLDPLLAALGDARRAPALVVLRHLVARLTSPPHPPVAGLEASPWSSLAIRLTSHLVEDVVFPVRLLLMLLTEARADLTSEQSADLGLAARRLLAWLWDTDSPDMNAARFALAGVCSSLASDPPATAALLRRGLCRRHVERRGFEELRFYADHMEDLEAVPGLVEALFTAAFVFEDAGEGEPGVNLGGPVMSLFSDRRQEFQMARYHLAAAFDGLMRRRPDTATLTLLRVLRASSRTRRYSPHRGPYATFTASGIECRVRDEWSAQTVALLRPPDDEAKMVTAWSSGLGELAAADEATLESVLSAFLTSNRSFGGWRLLVEAAIRDGRLMAVVIALVSAAPPVLSAGTLREPLCRLAFAARLQRQLMAELRLGIESQDVDPDARMALLGCFEGDSEPPSADEDAADTDAAAISVDSSSPSALAQWLSGDTEDQAQVPPNVRSEFAHLAESLNRHDSDHDADWRLASSVGERITRLDPDCGTEQGNVVLAVLLRVVQTLSSASSAGWDGDEHVQAIPEHSCVLDAVLGLTRLRAMGSCDEVLPAQTLRAIADHPLPWARMQLARASPLLFGREPSLTWSLLDKLAADPVGRVAADAVHVAARLRRLDPAKASGILDRVTPAHVANSQLVGEAVVMLAGLLVVDGVDELDRFEAIVSSTGRLSAVGSLLHGLRDSITPPAVDDAESVQAHDTTMRILRTVSMLAVRRYDEMVQKLNAGDDSDAREQAHDAIKALDAVVSQIYFASGAFRQQAEDQQLTPQQMSTLFDEVAEYLRGLLEHLPAPTIQHVVEIAAANADARPVEAFLLTGDAVLAARRVGYESDSLAKDVVLSMVRSYMADRPELFEGSTATARSMQAALVTILDSFVAVGWPEARAMAYHLGDLLR